MQTDIGAPGPGITELAEGLLHRLIYDWAPAVNEAVMAVPIADWPDTELQEIAQNAQDAIDGGADELEITHLAKTIEQTSRVSKLSETKPVFNIGYAVTEIKADARRRRFEEGRVVASNQIRRAAPSEVRDIIERIIEEPVPEAKHGLPELIADTISGKRQSIITPWKQLNGLTHALLPETICLLCGGPGAGKTFFLIQLINWFLNQEVPFSYYALEEDKNFVLLRLLAQNSQNAEILNPTWVRDNPDETQRFLKAFEPRIREFSKVIFAAPEKKIMLTDLHKWIKRRSAKGDRIIIIDPASVADFGQNIAQSVSEFIERSKDVTRRYKNSAIVALHPNTESMATGAINMGMLKGGANFAIQPQTILWLEMLAHGHEENVEMNNGGIHPLQFNRRLWLLKTRNGKGQGVKLAFNFSGDTLHFEELGIVRKLANKKNARNPQAPAYDEKEDDYDDNDTF